jgi:hypothetical protein
MPKITNVQIGQSNFAFINGVPIGWFINNKPVFFSPQSNCRDEQVRGGVAVVASIKDTTLKYCISQPLGGLTKYPVRKCICSTDCDDKKIVEYKLTVENRVVLRSKKRSYPWGINYQVETTFRENFLQVKVKIKRGDNNISISDPVINLSLYAYFVIGVTNLVTTIAEKGVIFGREESANLINENNYWIESLGGKILLLTSGTETCCLHSNDFYQQRCIQTILSKPYSFGGEGGVELNIGKEIEIGIALGLLSE